MEILRADRKSKALFQGSLILGIVHTENRSKRKQNYNVVAFWLFLGVFDFLIIRMRVAYENKPTYRNQYDKLSYENHDPSTIEHIRLDFRNFRAGSSRFSHIVHL